MQIPIPFGYKATVFTASNKPVDRKYRETVLVEIPEFAAGELPAVLTWRGNAVPDIHDGNAPPQVQAFAHDGGLFEPVLRRAWQREAGNYARVPVGADEVAVAVEGAPQDDGRPQDRAGISDIFVQDAARKPFREDDPHKHKGPPKASTVIESDRDRELKRARDMAGDFVVVAGELYRRIPEPVLVAHDKGVWIAAEPSTHPYRNVFRLDDGDLARERAHLIAAPPPGGYAVPAFTLHRPDLLTRDPEGGALNDSVTQILAAAGAQLAQATIPMMEAYCDLKEAFHPARNYSAEGYSERKDPDPAELVALGTALCDAMGGDAWKPATVRECRHGFERAAERIVAPAAGVAP